MMETTRPWFAAALLFVAGVYQLTPLKEAACGRASSPLVF